MEVRVFEPTFVLPRHEPRFFVMQLGSDDEGYSSGYRFGIQLCNESLQGAAVILFRGDEAQFTVPEFDIPEAVYRAALRQVPGKGDFVDSQGVSVKRLF
jgi:hypothetical protein